MSFIFDFFEITGRNIFYIYDSIFSTRKYNRRRMRHNRKLRKRNEEMSILKKIASSIGLYQSKKRNISEKDLDNEVYLQRKKRLLETKKKMKYTDLYRDDEEEKNQDEEQELNNSNNYNNKNNNNLNTSLHNKSINFNNESIENLSSIHSPNNSSENISLDEMESQKIKSLQEELEKLRQEISKITSKMENSPNNSNNNNYNNNNKGNNDTPITTNKSFGDQNKIPTPPPLPPIEFFNNKFENENNIKFNNDQSNQNTDDEPDYDDKENNQPKFSIAEIVKHAIINGKTKLKPVSTRGSPNRKRTDNEKDNVEFVLALKNKFKMVVHSPSSPGINNTSDWDDTFN